MVPVVVISIHLLLLQRQRLYLPAPLTELAPPPSFLGHMYYECKLQSTYIKKNYVEETVFKF